MPETVTLYGRPQAARLLNVSVTTLDRQIKAGRIHAARIGRRVVVSAQALEAYRKAIEEDRWGSAS